MDIHHQDSRVVRDNRKPENQSRFDVNGMTTNREPNVVMKLPIVNPIRACFGYFINLAAASDKFVHQPPNVLVIDRELTLNPSPRLLRQLKQNISAYGPISKRIFVRGKSVWVG